MLLHDRNQTSSLLCYIITKWKCDHRHFACAQHPISSSFNLPSSERDVKFSLFLSLLHSPCVSKVGDGFSVPDRAHIIVIYRTRSVCHSRKMRNKCTFDAAGRRWCTLIYNVPVRIRSCLSHYIFVPEIPLIFVLPRAKFHDESTTGFRFLFLS